MYGSQDKLWVVPRNRRPQDREEKRSEIVAAAERLFTEDGYDRTSMANIATAARVTPTTIYWYFEDKDELLIAVLDHVLAAALDQYVAVADQEIGEQMLWVLHRLERFRKLVTVVHSRTAVSAGIDAWHNGFHQLVETLLADGLRQAGVPETDVAAMTTIGVFVVEGLLTHQHDESEKRALIELVTRDRLGQAPAK